MDWLGAQEKNNCEQKNNNEQRCICRLQIAVYTKLEAFLNFPPILLPLNPEVSTLLNFVLLTLSLHLQSYHLPMYSCSIYCLMYAYFWTLHRWYYAGCAFLTCFFLLILISHVGLCSWSSLIFHCCIILYCMIIPPFIHSIDCWWTFGLFPVFTVTNKVAMKILEYNS